MRKLRIDHGYWVVLALCVLAVWPFLRYASLPHDTDAELHVFRLAELARMWEGGIVYPRWAANFYYGYGYPIFNYYAPLTYYIGLVFNLIPSFDPVASTKLVLLLGLVGAAVGMYGFMLNRFGRLSGFVAAASYIYAPYILYIDPHGRGVLPESFSFCVFPFALWSLDRLMQRPSAQRFITTVLLLAAIILTHNLMAMVFGGLLFAYFLWQLMFGTAHHAASWMPRSTILVTVAAFALGVGSAAFFWLPMVFEQYAIQISTVIGAGSHYDFRNHFMSLGELFGPMPRFDWGASEPYYTRSLGMVQWGLGLAGFGRILLTRNRHRAYATFFALFALTLIFLMLPASEILWQTIPMLPFLQFPWRLLGATNAMLAVLGGLLVAPILSEESVPQDVSTSSRSILAAVLVALILLFALPLIQVKPWPDFGGTAASDVLDSEIAGRWRGTTSTADFVPSTVDVSPRAQDQIIAQIAANERINPLNRDTLGDASVTSTLLTPTHFRYAVSSPDFLVLRFFVFDFPGWQATIDGVPAKIELATPDGFVTIPVEAGDHVVELKFTDTPTRQLSWAVSAVALLMTVGVGVIFGRKSQIPTPDSTQQATQLTPVVTAVALITLAYVLVLDPAGLLRHNSQGSVVQPAQIDDQDVAFEDKVDLIGFNLPDALSADTTHDIVLFWKAQRQLDENYQVFVHLIHDELGLIAQSDKLNPGDFPTKSWSLDEYIRDSHRLTLPPDLPAGTYSLSVGLWNAETGERLTVTRTPQPDSATLQTYQVEK